MSLRTQVALLGAAIVLLVVAAFAESRGLAGATIVCGVLGALACRYGEDES